MRESAAAAFALQERGQRAARMRGAAGGDVVDGAGPPRRTPAGSPLGAEVDEPVGAADEVEVVLDGDDGVAGLEELAERGEEDVDVAAVQARGRLVEQEQRRAGAGLEVRGQLDALRFAARQRRRRLA